MSLGTITFASDAGGMPSAPTFIDLISFPGDTAYPTGGTPGFASLVQRHFNDAREIMGVVAQDCGGMYVAYDKINNKLKVFQAASGGEVANTTDLSGTTFRVLVFAQ